MRVKGRPWSRARPPPGRRASTASRSARANALNDASTMWCAFVPASTAHVQRELGGVRDRAEELLGELGVEVAHALGRELALEGGERAAGDVDRGRGARLVHRARRRGRSGGCRRGRRAPRRAPARARCRCPRRCGASRSRGRPPPARRGRAGRGAPPRRAGGRRSRRRSRARPRPCRRGRATAGRRSRPSCDGSARCGSRAALHGFCVHRKALGTRERGAGGREASGRLGAARIREPCAAGTWPATAPTGTERRRRWAARGWSRRRSPRTRWPAPAPTNRQPAFRTRSASASASSPTSSRCSGAISSASRERRARRRSSPPAAPPLRVARR